MKMEAMIDAIVTDMEENWDNDSVLTYAMTAYRGSLEGLSNSDVQHIHDKIIGEGNEDV